MAVVVVVIVSFQNCNRHTADIYIFVVIPSEQYSRELCSEYDKQALRYIGDGRCIGGCTHGYENLS